jgi:NADH-quinone oxidoreductase subunit N
MQIQCLNLWAVFPEMWLAALGILLVLLVGFTYKKYPNIIGIATIIGFVIAIILTARELSWHQTSVFCNTYAIDGFATIFKLLLETAGLVSVIGMISYFHKYKFASMVPIAVLFAVLGGILLASSLDLGLILLSLEIISIASYPLVAFFRSDRKGNEAVIKYFLYAAVSFSIMAFGLTYLYGLTGSLALPAIAEKLRGTSELWFSIAFILVLVGFAFKASIAPFHFWAPDVYEGSSAPVAGFLSIIPKIAAFAGLLRFLVTLNLAAIIHWQIVIAVFSMLSMTIGNLLALRQTNVKRLLAYSSIAQAGYVLMAVAVAGAVPSAITATIYYLASYLFMNLGAFFVIARIEEVRGNDSLSLFDGLGKRSPFLAAALTIFLLSLAGMPPLGGFAGKILLLSVTLKGGLLWLALIGILNMAVGLYYYLSIIAKMYFKEPAEKEIITIGGMGYIIALTLNLIGVFVLGIIPGLVLPLIGLGANFVR